MRKHKSTIAGLVLAACSVVGMATPASAGDCGKFTPTCQKVENLVCELTHRCL